MNVCTIIAKNYIAHARVLARSLAKHNPESRLWTLIIDDFSRYVDPEREPFDVLSPADIGCDAFPFMALRYSVLELSTAVKPWLLRYLMEHTGGPVTYLDPDIKVFGPLQRLDELAARHGVALIPHNNQPLPADGRKPSQIDVMIAGVYNLGYVSLAPRPEVEHLLDWWSERLRRDCRVDPIWGYFVDQRWFDLVPGFLTDFAIIREPEYNVAYWNLHSRRLDRVNGSYTVDGRPLAFFHFSGFDPAHPLSLSLHQNRIDVTAEPVLESLLGEYARDVMGADHAVSRNWPYSYVALGDGTPIDDFVRGLCEDFADAQESAGQRTPSPFTLEGARGFDAWLREDTPAGPPGVNRLLTRIYAERADLQGAFPDLTGPDRDQLLRWAATIGQREVPLLAKVTSSEAGVPAVPPGLAPRTRATGSRDVASVPVPQDRWGVNVVGPFHSSCETGEVARNVVGALDSQGIASVPVDDWSAPVAGSDGSRFATIAPDQALFPVSLICGSPDALAEFARQAGDRFFAGRYSVGLWFVDAACVPDHCLESLSLVQGLWAPSSYASQVLESLVTVPVDTVRIPVQPPPFQPRTREELGLPEGKCLFLSGFESGSGFARMNPLAVVEAFQSAFAPDDAAHLLLHGANGNYSSGERARLREAAHEHPGIQLIEGPTARSESVALTAVCDCYVSLHRVVAFGLPLAEAMWLGKPVVATRYSGSLDYMTAENSALVDYKLVPAASNGDRDAGGGEWAEPDVEHAAALMRRIFEDPAGAHVLGHRAATDVRARHSLIAAGELFARRLESIRSTGHVTPTVGRGGNRWPALARAEGRIRQGPPRVPRGGPRYRARALLRTAILRLLRPYSEYQQSVNMAVVAAMDEIDATTAIERSQLMSELRGSDRLRSAVEIEARGLDEVRRIVGLQADRGLYLAIGELARRHAVITSERGDPPDSLALAGFELRAYSQNGEDGALAEILRRVGAPSRFFVEFGVESGREGNCVYLADVAGWSGLFMEADDQLYRLLERKYGPKDAVRTIQARISPENVEQLFSDGGVPTEPDVLSIDVDGQDYWIWAAIEHYRPRVVVIEYNSALDPQRRLVQPNEPGRPWDGTEYFGASLGALVQLGERLGYRLVHTELSGANAFFVRIDLATDALPDPADVSRRAVPNYYQSGYRHPAASRGRHYLDLDSGELIEVQSLDPN